MQTTKHPDTVVLEIVIERRMNQKRIASSMLEIIVEDEMDLESEF